MSQRSLIAFGSLSAYAVFIGTLFLMPVVKSDYSAIDQTISEAAIGERAWVQSLGFAALVLASLGISWLLYAERRLAPPIVWTAGLLALSTVFTVVLAVVPTDAPDETTAGGRVHIIAASLAFLIAIAGITSAGVTFRDHSLLSPLALWSFVAGALAFALLLVTGSGIEPSGAWQRATVAVEVGWFVAVGVRLMVAGAEQPRIRQSSAMARESGQV